MSDIGLPGFCDLLAGLLVFAVATAGSGLAIAARLVRWRRHAKAGPPAGQTIG